MVKTHRVNKLHGVLKILIRVAWKSDKKVSTASLVHGSTIVIDVLTQQVNFPDALPCQRHDLSKHIEHLGRIIFFI